MTTDGGIVYAREWRKIVAECYRAGIRKGRSPNISWMRWRVEFLGRGRLSKRR